jgi:ABC-type glycerol-3-phosphate transport system substrate-binding protein
MSRKHGRLLITVLLAGVLLSACGGGGSGASSGGVPADAALKVTGSVSSEVGWSEADLKAMDTMDVDYTNKDGETSTYTGVLINDLLDKAGVASGATAVVFVADDGYTSELTLEEVQGCADCIIAFRDEGGFSTVMPNFSGKAQVKGVIEIQVK